jgi:hypothetical protein
MFYVNLEWDKVLGSRHNYNSQILYLNSREMMLTCGVKIDLMTGSCNLKVSKTDTFQACQSYLSGVSG